LLLKNCRVVNVYSGEIYLTDIAIEGDRIVSTAAHDSVHTENVIDCAGKYAVPGMIDAHMHVDTTFLWPGELARLIVPLGTTSLFIDTTNIAHTGGVEAIQALMKSFQGLPLRGYFAAPSYCPFNTRLETAAAEIATRDIATLLDSGCVGIGETVWSKIALGNTDYLEVIRACRDRGGRVSGHGGEIRRGDEPAFDAYVSAGIQDDHCIGRGEDILPRLRRGLKLFLVEASGRRGQLKPLLSYALHNTFRFGKCVCVSTTSP
jgi:adenine deaminase